MEQVSTDNHDEPSSKGTAGVGKQGLAKKFSLKSMSKRNKIIFGSLAALADIVESQLLLYCLLISRLTKMKLQRL